MKNFTLLLGLILANLSFTAQVHYEKMYYADHELETKQYTAKFSGVIGLYNEVKFGLKINNSGENVLLYKPSESKVVCEKGEIKVDEKDRYITPGGFKMWTINALQDGMNSVKNFTLNFSGMYEIVPEENSISMDELKLPLASNEFGTKEVECSIKSSLKKTSKTMLKIEVTNKSDKYLVIHPNRVSVIMPDENTYACANKKDNVEIVPAGETVAFTVYWDKMPGGSANDMQLRDMYVQWDNVFFFANEVALEEQIIEFEWDEKMTIEKNQ